VIAGDFWRTALRFGVPHPYVHPGQISLFDPDALK